MKFAIKNSLLLILLVGIFPFLKGQSISVLSSANKKPVSFALVIIKPLKGDFTIMNLFSDSNGIVKFPNNLINLNATILIRCSGYQDLIDTLKINKFQSYYLNEEIIGLNEVIVTAQYKPGSAESAVHSIKVIDSKKIRAMAAQNLRDVLGNELNIRISQDNVLGSGMSLQGIGGQNVKILIDGVPVSGRLNGNIDISQINMNNVERIEIIEGPLSVSYGTDALAGTINIITKKTQKEQLTFSTNSYYESVGQYNFSGSIGIVKGKNIIKVNGGRNYFDGWNNWEKPFYTEKVQIADSNRFKSWKAKEQYFGSFYFGRYFKGLKFGYSSDYFYEQIANHGLPRLPYFENAFDEYYTTNRFTNSLNLTGPLNSKYFTNILFAFNQYKRIKNTFYNDLTTLNETLTENPGDQDTTKFNDITARGTLSTTKDSTKLNYEIGYDINLETMVGLRIQDSQKRIDDYAIFISSEFKAFTKLTIRPGVRFIYNSVYKAPVVPSVNVRYEINSKSTIRFSYARGFRAPSLKELYFQFVDINHNITGNINLMAEQSNNFNLSVNFKTQTKKTQWKFESSVFYNEIENMISLAQLAGTQYSYFNIDKFKTLGAQLQTNANWKNLKLNLGGAYIARYNQLSQQFKSEKFTWSPEGRCNILYEWHKPNIVIALFYKYTGELPSFQLNGNSEFNKTKIDDYHTADFSVSKLFWKNKLNASVGSKNIFNVVNIIGSTTGENHATSANTVSVGMGRTYFIKLDISLTGRK